MCTYVCGLLTEKRLPLKLLATSIGQCSVRCFHEIGFQQFAYIKVQNHVLFDKIRINLKSKCRNKQQSVNWLAHEPDLCQPEMRGNEEGAEEAAGWELVAKAAKWN